MPKALALLRSAFALECVQSDDSLSLGLTSGVARRAVRWAVVCLLPWLLLIPEVSPASAPAIGGGYAFVTILWLGWERYHVTLRRSARLIAIEVRPRLLQALVRHEILLDGLVQIRKAGPFAAMVIERDGGRSYTYMPDPLVRTPEGESVYDLVSKFATSAAAEDRVREPT